MKNTFTVLFLFSLSFVSRAQFTIQNSDKLPASGVSAPVYYASTSLGLGSSDGVVADFSNLSFYEIGNLNIVNAATSQYYSTFPSANFAYTISPVSGGTFYYYFKTSSTKMEILATDYTTTGSNPVRNYKSNPYQYLQFPFSPSESFADSYQEAGKATQSLKGTFEATGKLFLQDVTFENIARIKLESEGTVKYAFWSLNPLFPILLYNNGQISYYALPVVTGTTNATETTALSVYPNPASDNLTIKMNDNRGSYDFQIVNPEGETVKELILPGVECKVDISTLSPGIYVWSLKKAGIPVKQGKLAVSR